MKNLLLTAGCLVAGGFAASGQDRAYTDSAYAVWQRHYKEEFLTDARSPLQATDTGFIRFYPYRKNWVYAASRLERTMGGDTLFMATHSGKTKPFRKYGVLTCEPPRCTRRPRFRVTLYQSLSATADTNLLFLPFFDRSNGSATYGGGRYLDLRRSDFRGDRLTVDFNRAYNPWCAYKEGYNCPVPPEDNRLKLIVEAGERNFALHPEEKNP